MGRPKGQGTISPIAPSPAGTKRWRVAVTMADGRRVWRTAHSPREAERIRGQLVEARELDLDPTRQTLAVFLRGWIDGMAQHNRVRPRTLDHYRLIVETHIVPKLGGLKLSQVTARRIQAWLDADPAAPRTVRHHHAVLRRALNRAVRQRLLPYNPANAVELPAVRDDKADPLTLDEAKALLDATRKDRLGPLWRLALVTGMREGELLGLAWDDVEPDAITVRSQLQRRVTPEERAAAKAEGRKPVGAWGLVTPKAARRVKRIALDSATSEALEAHRRKMTSERRADGWWYGLVFVTSDGKPYHQAEVLKAWKAACKRAGIRERRFHDARHSAAHLLNDEGVDEPTRMARLGHNTTAMARHYGGASEAQDRAAADRLGAALGG